MTGKELFASLEDYIDSNVATFCLFETLFSHKKQACCPQKSGNIRVLGIVHFKTCSVH